MTVGVEADAANVDKLLGELAGKDLAELIKEGTEKLASVPSGGGGGGAAPAAGGGGGGGAAAAKAPEPEPEEEEEASGSVWLYFRCSFAHMFGIFFCTRNTQPFNVCCMHESLELAELKCLSHLSTRLHQRYSLIRERLLPDTLNVF